MLDLNEQWDDICEEYYRRKPVGPPNTEVGAKAEEFFESLITEGRKPCDRTAETFDKQFQLPPYYEEKLFKNGQAFFRKHFLGMIFGTILGLSLLLSTPGAVVLAMTKQSKTPRTAFKRYMATFMHMMAWYQGDSKPDSKMWVSLKAVRSMHNSASKKSTVKLNYPVSQLEMSITLFVFIGIAVTRSEKIGIYNATKDELKALIHFWRVIGYMLGIEDKFNICRASVDETIVIIELILEKIFKPLIEKPSNNFKALASAYYSGLKNIFPWSDADVYVHYLHMIVDNTNDIDLKKDCLNPLTTSQRSTLSNTIYYFSKFRSEVFRIIINTFAYIIFIAFPIFLRFKNVKVNLEEII